MRKALGCALFAVFLLGVSSVALAASPVIDDVQLRRYISVRQPDWTDYGQGVTVTVSDPDGAADIASVSITDPGGTTHVITPGGGGGWVNGELATWSQLDDDTIICEWSKWPEGMDEPAPAAGAYTIAAADAGGDQDSLMTAAAPAITGGRPVLLAPEIESVISDVSPAFQWTEGVPGSVRYEIEVDEEGTGNEAIWAKDLGVATEAIYNFDGSALRATLQPNHSYIWMVKAYHPDDDRVSNPRVSMWTNQSSYGRFTVYGDWPETPPELPGKLAYRAQYSYWNAPAVAVHTVVMGYNTDPHRRVWMVGDDTSRSPDWSPDGSRLLFTRGDGVYIESFDGNPPYRVQNPGIRSRWAPDANRIAYEVYGPYSPELPENYDIWVSNIDGTNARAVADSFDCAERWPNWSPDGVWIAYNRTPDDAGLGIWLVRYDGASNHPFVPTGVVGYPGHSVQAVLDPAWSPDGRQLALGFTAAEASGASIQGIATVSRDGGPLVPVFVSPQTFNCCGAPSSPEWSPDGSQIVFTSAHYLADPVQYWFEPRTELFLINADRSGAPVRLTYDNSYDFYVTWWGPNTLVGTGSDVTIVDAVVTFESVSADGSTTIVVSPPPAAAPDGMAFMGDYAYTVSTTAGISGAITVAIDYSDTAYPAVVAERLSLLLWDGNAWVDITTLPIDTANTIIRGQFTPGAEREWFIALALSAPKPPTITYPADGSVIAETAPTFTWDAVPGADHLCLCLEEAGHNTPYPWQKWDISGEAVSILYNEDGLARDSELTAGSRYRLHVIAWFLDGGGGGDPVWSYGEGIVDFWVGPRPAPVPIQGTMLLSPAPSVLLTGDSWNVTPAPVQGWLQDLTPDGTKLAYCGDGDTIHVCNADGTNDVALSLPEGLVAPFLTNISPDGQRILFSSEIEGDEEVCIVNTDGSGFTQITHSPGEDHAEGWSPDGRYVLWMSTADWRVWVGRADGTESHPITGPGLPLGVADWPTWSPDGTRIALVWERYDAGGNLFAILGTVKPDGSDPQPILEYAIPDPGNWTLWPNYLEWSPDGSQIAYMTTQQALPDVGVWADFEVYLVPVSGGDPVRVTYNFTREHRVSWIGPNTTEGAGSSVTVMDATVTFESVGAGGWTSIVVSPPPAAAPDGMAFVGDHAYTVSTTAGISGAITVAVDYSDTAYPAVLAERLSLLLWDGNAWVDITTLPIDTANTIIRGQFTPGAEREWFIALALSPPAVPKGKVMFSGCTEGRPSGPGLFVADADFSDAVRLTTPAPPEAGEQGRVGSLYGCDLGVPSPDATQVALFHSGQLAVLDLGALLEVGGQEAQLLGDEQGQPVRSGIPCWSPDSNQLAYGSRDETLGQDVVCAINADGTGKRILYAAPGAGSWSLDRVQWSPDGTRLAFETGPAGRRHIGLLEDLSDPGGPTFRELTSDPAFNDMQPFWSPDGTRVAFTRSLPDSEWAYPYSDVWLADVVSGDQRQLTDTPGVDEHAGGWCPLDGYIYFAQPGGVGRILPDGSGQETVAAGVSVISRFSWIRSGVWVDGLNALPGELVSPKLGIADAENLAGVQAKVRYNGLGMYSAELGGSILDWAMPNPVIGPETISLLGVAPDPENQSISGVAHLFNLDVTNPADAAPGSTRLLTFDELLLSDDMGEPMQRTSVAGGVHTIPFAGLQMSTVAGPVGADPLDPLPVPVTITALDRNGWTMSDASAPLTLSALDPGASPLVLAETVSPSEVAMAGGVWSGQVAFVQPGVQLHVAWEDIGVHSDSLQAISKGDANADNSVSIFDVVKIANMAIGRGTWSEWQTWAGDMNRDHVVDIFDVVRCANAAMQAMGTMAVGRGGVSAAQQSLAGGPITVIATLTDTGTAVTMAVDLSQCAGLAGVQFELQYDAKKLRYAGMSRGALLTASWAALDNDLGGKVKAIAYTASGDVLSGGKGTVLSFTFSRIGKGSVKPALTSAALSDAEGTAVACTIAGPKVTGKGK